MDIEALIALAEKYIPIAAQVASLGSALAALVTQAKAVASAADQPALDALLASLNGQREAAVAAADAALESAS